MPIDLAVNDYVLELGQLEAENNGYLGKTGQVIQVEWFSAKITRNQVLRAKVRFVDGKELWVAFGYLKKISAVDALGGLAE